jgi:hypothetical protein
VKVASTEALAPPAEFHEASGSNPVDEAYDAWRQADEIARELERKIGEAWARHERGAGAPPSRDVLHELAWLQYAAGEKLQGAISLLITAGYIQPAHVNPRRRRVRAVTV